MKQDEIRAANWFHWIGLTGLLLSAAVFILYFSAVIPTAVSPGESVSYWEEPSEEYLMNTGLDFESGWFRQISDAYFMSSAALALLASAALPTLLVLSLTWFFRKDFLYGTMALIICGVILTAVAG